MAIDKDLSGGMNAEEVTGTSDSGKKPAKPLSTSSGGSSRVSTGNTSDR